MSRVLASGNRYEMAVRSAIFAHGLRFRVNVRSLPGCPDIVFPRSRIAVFLDGDFWHGYQFNSWSATLTPRWREKIDKTRRRDQRNRRRLQRAGWRVLRFWQHEIDRDLDKVVAKIVAAQKGKIQLPRSRKAA
jgi:DNA mismatch endonuclease (patch repair protein)